MVVPEPTHVYAVRVLERFGRSGLLVDVDLGFRHWRRNLPVTLAGTGSSRVADGLHAGVQYVMQTRRRGQTWVARLVDTAPAYTYTAVLGIGHDGDNLRASIDLGFDQWIEGQSIRLDGGNARELAEPGGREAAAHLARLAPPGTAVLLRSLRADKYGDRYGARVSLPDGSDLTGELVAGGWLAPWDGRGPKPIPRWPRITAAEPDT